MKLLLYYYTLRHLKFIQLWYRIPILKKWSHTVSKKKLNLDKAGNIPCWIPSTCTEKVYSDKNSFTFLNQTHIFEKDIDWDFCDKGLLWNYNLNYFEYLTQPGIDALTGYGLIDNYIRHYPELKHGHDPYPISLRLVYWIRFFIEQRIRPDKKYFFALHSQAKELQSKIEFHLLGNHLLENAFAIFFAGIYLEDSNMIKQGRRLLSGQLNEQILQDGGHFELSPMYHQLMLYRLLDVINISKCTKNNDAKEIIPLLNQKAAVMLGWMQQMCFCDGSFPLFNDSAYGIAPSPVKIKDYASRLGIEPSTIPFSGSGYRKWLGANWEMFIKAASPNPPYQPGHAHCDAMSFTLSVNQKPIVVDTGTSVYDAEPDIRKRERSTSAHNTVQIGDWEQSEIWGTFRMARRAKVTIIEENTCKITLAHNGFYFKKGYVHTRTFNQASKLILIKDEVEDYKNEMHIARIHFHPEIALRKLANGIYSFTDGQIYFNGFKSISICEYNYAPFFGKRQKAEGLEILFERELITKITILL